MQDRATVQCPSCGGSSFAEVGPNRIRCVFCGTVITSQARPNLVMCPQCGAYNELDVNYCNRCGEALPQRRSAPPRKIEPPAYTSTPRPATRSSTYRTRPATYPTSQLTLPQISMLVSVMGSLLLPIIAPIAGLYLARQARAKAQAGEDVDAKQAQNAMVVGWVALGLSLCPFFLWCGASPCELFYAPCRWLVDLIEELSTSSGASPWPPMLA